ncbi:LADA_0E04390g1_1 [Lachancea dasiensis]|uniref:LADA_0E04390g1_1 n=1 Tax=Lachancea dasiensis TaxID=1072105 RepID=A0A1G4JBZ1_9SACH|nr:LADA_0E04390g1_1 [Lachancea dasiensis]
MANRLEKTPSSQLSKQLQKFGSKVSSLNDSSETFKAPPHENKGGEVEGVNSSILEANKGCARSIRAPDGAKADECKDGLSPAKRRYSQEQHSRSRNTLIRVYSENERSNFNDFTGARLYDDLKYRPVHHDGSSGSPVRSSPIDIASKSKRRHSFEEDLKIARVGPHIPGETYNDMQDEYVPDFDFSNVVSQWQSDEHLNASVNSTETEYPRAYNGTDYDADLSRSSSMSSSSIILRTSHAKVAPIPLPEGKLPIVSPSRIPHHDLGTNFNDKPSRASPLTYYRTRPALSIQPNNEHIRNFKRQRSGQELDSPCSPWTGTSVAATSYISSQDGRLSTEDLKSILDCLPTDFFGLPYSRRKRVLLDKYPGIDYKSVMPRLKKTHLSSENSNTQSQANVSRRGSLASQYLSSFTPSSSSYKPNDKGAVVMGHMLGKIIGFGAWGMVRECYQIKEDMNKSGISSESMKAVKIVRFRNNATVKARVLKEVELWSRLKHSNLLPLLQWKLDDDNAVYCLTDKVSGGTLYDLVASWGNAKDSAIDLSLRCQVTANLGLQIVRALRYMHSQHVVHGDVKLENCLLAERCENQWTVILCDFGMSSEFGKNEDERDNQEISRSPFLTLRRVEEPPKSSPLPSAKERPTISRSESSTETTLGLKPNKQFRNKHLNLGNSLVGVSSFPKNYGPGLTSTNLSRIFPSKGELTAPGIKKSEGEASPVTTNLESTPSSCSEEKESPSLSIIGSLPYAAPELLEPVPPPLAPSADVWALGVTIYTMLMGKLLFKHDYEPRLRAMIAAAKYDSRPLEDVCSSNSNQPPDGPNTLYQAVKGSLLKDTSARWTLDAVGNALHEYVNSLDALQSS